MDEVKKILAEIGFLKAKRQALDKLLEEKYAVVEAELKRQGLQKCVHEGISATYTMRTTWAYMGGASLMEYIKDPVEFGRVLMTNMTMTKKLVEALARLGLPTAKFFQAREKQVLTIRTGKDDSFQQKLDESQAEYLKGLEVLQEQLAPLVSPSPITPVFPEQTKMDKDIAEMGEEDNQCS